MRGRERFSHIRERRKQRGPVTPQFQIWGPDTRFRFEERTRGMHSQDAIPPITDLALSGLLWSRELSELCEREKMQMSRTHHGAQES